MNDQNDQYKVTGFEIKKQYRADGILGGKQ